MKKYIVQLSEEQRQGLKHLLGSGVAPARTLMHAQILLKADSSEGGPAWSDEHIQRTFEVGISTVERVRKRFAERGLEEALNRRPQPERPEKRILNGKHEAYLIALCCSDKPEGHAQWSVRLLAHKMVELGHVEQVGRETVRVALKKTNSNRGSGNSGVSPRNRMRSLSITWKTCWRCIIAPMMPGARRSAWMNSASNCSPTQMSACP